jgi:hypothetical protein
MQHDTSNKVLTAIWQLQPANSLLLLLLLTKGFQQDQHNAHQPLDSCMQHHNRDSIGSQLCRHATFARLALQPDMPHA